MVTGIDGDGQPINMSATIPGTGWNIRSMDRMEFRRPWVAVKTVNANTLNVTVKVNDKLVSSGRVVLSKDGKTMTSSFKGEDPKGRKIDNVEVYEKQ